MRYHVLTLFPDMIMQALGTSIIGKALEKESISLEAIDIREYTKNKHKKVDDTPYGGGAGMVMQAQPVYDAYTKAKDKSAFRAKHEAELVIFEAAKSTLLAMQGDQKLPSLKSLQAEHERLSQEQQRLYEERASLKKQAKQIDTIKANVDMFLSLVSETEVTKKKITQLE